MNESDIQKAVFQQLRERAPANAVFWHPPNDRASRTKSGYLPGVSDVHILHNGEFFALELKTETGRATVEQMDFTSRVNRADGFSFISHGLDNALAVLKSWNLLK